MTRQPDEDYDIIVYESRGAWTIWFHGEKLGEWATRASAIEFANDVALLHSRPAWLLRPGVTITRRSLSASK